MNLLKVAFYQGANQALVDLGISKLAAKAPPITDNPYEDAPGANVKKVLGTSLEEIDDMFARIDAMSKNKQTAVSSKKPASRKAPARQSAKGDVVTSKKPSDGKLRAAFPDSPGLVDAMRLGLTNQERQIGISPKATGSAPSKAPNKPMGNS